MTQLENKIQIFDYKRDNGIVALMDGGGSTVQAIGRHLPIRIVATGMPVTSKARERAKELNAIFVEFDIKKYEESKGVVKGDYWKSMQILNSVQGVSLKSNLSPEQVLQIRDDACNLLFTRIQTVLIQEGLPDNVPYFAGGFEFILPESITKNNLILNNHPGDLRVIGGNGKRTYVGLGEVPSIKALKAGEVRLYTSIHQMTSEMDEGPVFMLGYSLPINYELLNRLVDIKDNNQLTEIAKAAQNSLKYLGDYVLPCIVFNDIFDGKWGFRTDADTSKKILVYNFRNEWIDIPAGITMEYYEDLSQKNKFLLKADKRKDMINMFWRDVEKIAMEYKKK